MYPLIELATGLLFVAAFVEFGVTQTMVKWLFFTCLIVVLAVTDLRVRLLPDVVNWPGFAAGLMFSAFVPPDHEFAGFLVWRFLRFRMPEFAAGILDGILGAAFGSFLLWGLAKGYRAVRRRDGLGMGDVKMMAMVGAFLGLRGTFLTLLVGSLLGSVMARAGNRERVAMGDREAIPVAAGDVSRDWRARHRVWRTGDCGAVADSQGDRWIEGRIKVQKFAFEEQARKEKKGCSQRCKPKTIHSTFG